MTGSIRIPGVAVLSSAALLLAVTPLRAERPRPAPGDCQGFQGSLAPGQTYTVEVDAHTGDEDTTEPKLDANDGRNGDRVDFRRTNVARAHNEYWYTSSYQSAGEPDPGGPQWVDYAPDFGALGVGWYEITIRFRDTGNRASYPVEYHILDTGHGDQLVEQRQDIGEGYHDITIGAYWMCAGSGPDGVCRASA